jgi:protoporphyrinogen/coproporphyrinogen III oxidase
MPPIACKHAPTGFRHATCALRFTDPPRPPVLVCGRRANPVLLATIMLKETRKKTVAVIGAGVTGLTTAHALRKAGHTVVVIERSERPGGSIRTSRMDGYLIESGPNTMLMNEQRLLDFFGEIGLAGELIEAAPEAKNRYIVRDGRPVAAPMSLGQFIKTPLLSGGAKWRLLREPFVGRAKPDVEESVAEFARRRLGPEIVDYAISPLIGGIYAGDPERLSVRYAFPTLHRFDRDHGSIVRGGIATARARRKAGQKRFKSRSISFRNGLQAIIDALVRQVGDSLFTQATVESLEPSAPWRVRFSRPGDPVTEKQVDVVAVTTPGYATAGLPFQNNGAASLASLAEVEYPPVTTVSTGFQRDHVAHPLDGYGVLVPAKETAFRVLGTLFNSSLFPGRAPAGCVLVTSFVGGMRHPELAVLPPAELREIVLDDVRRLLGVTGDPLLVHTHTWPRAIPQYNLGYGRQHEAMEAAEKQMPGLFLGGHVRDGVSVGDCIRAGLKLAERIDGA